MAKKQFAPPVTNFSISCDPSMVTWLNEYAHTNRTSRSQNAVVLYAMPQLSAYPDNGGFASNPHSTYRRSND